MYFCIMTPKEFAKQENISYYKALKYFKNNNLKISGSGGNNRKIIENPFIMEEEFSDYFLGLLASDGNVSQKGQVKLKLKDKELIVKLIQFLGNKTNLLTESTKTGIMYKTLFRNKEIKEFLFSIGIVPRKSLIFEYQGILNRDFLRGFFDGDGCVSVNREVKITCGSKKFINQLSELFDSKGFNYAIHKKGNCFDIKIKSASRKSFFDYLYQDSNIYLERKYKKYCGLLEQSNKKTPNIGGSLEVGNTDT